MTNIVCCQVCLTPFRRISDLKKHVRADKHRQKMREIFNKDKFRYPDMFPNIKVANLVKRDTHPIVGLSLLTLCFSPEINSFFYLCHVCEEKCPPDRIVSHLHSGGHCSNYFNYTDPNILIFSWVPSMDMRVILRPELKKKVIEIGSGQLQVLDLPENLLRKLETSIYSEVMRTLNENDKLLKLIEDVKPKRTMIQTYQRDKQRKHPLLGMQHLVECICVGPTEKRYYLCTLCKLTFATHMIIKHVLSFDHIHTYFKKWHPSTLMSKECYMDNTNSLASIILDFAKQTEQIHGTTNAEMKQVSLEPDQFKSVNFNCYAEALKGLESMTQEGKENRLTTIIEPGNKLVRCVSSAVSGALQYKLRCQNCNMTFDSACQYSKHLAMFNHAQMLENFFGNDGSACDDYKRKVWQPRLELYRYLKYSLKQNQQAIGTSLVVMCFTSEDQVEPFYVCFACEECFPQSLVWEHFPSRKHLVHTLLYYNPWRLPFAWKDSLDVQNLRSMALDEEKERGPNQMMLKILDIPFMMLGHFHQNYPNVMASLNNTEYQTLLMQEVPQRETYSKLVQNEKFPLLGEQFLVMHDVHFPQQQFTDRALLCLLCTRRLSEEECYAHVFSHEHVLSFLQHFHPGSVKSSTVEEILDLAKQAAQIHPISHKQVIHLDRPIWEPCTYERALCILRTAKKRAGKGPLNPPILLKKKLVPRKILEDTHQETSQVVEESEKQTSGKPIDNIETTLKNISVEVGTDATNTCSVESVGEIPTPSEKESERRTEMSSETSTDAIRNVGRESLQIKEEQIGIKIKEEMIEEPLVREPIGATLESCQNSNEANRMEVEEEKGKCSNDIKQLKNGTCHENKRKRPSSTGDKSTEETCPNMDGEQEMDHKRQRLTSKQDSSCEEPQNLPSIEKKEVTPAEDGEGSKPVHEMTKDEGFGALFKCQCDQRDTGYFCGCCTLKSPERDIIINQKMNKVVSDLQEEIYNNVAKQNFKSDVEELKTQQNVCCGLTTSSAGSVVQHVDASINHPTRHTVSCVPDDLQVVEMEIDDPEDTEASSVTAASSEVTETTSKTIESNEDVRTRTELSESTDNANAPSTMSRSIKRPSSLHRSTSVTNATCLHPDSTGNGLKAEIISNTTLGQKNKIATNSSTEGTFQIVATSLSPVITTKSMMTTSKCPTRSPSSATDAIKSTTPNSRITTSPSSCAATTPASSRLRESARPTCDASVTTAKLTAVTCDSSTTFKMEKDSNCETASKTIALSQTLASSVKSENTQTSAETMKQPVGPNAHVRFRSSPAAPDSNALMLVGSENRNPPRKALHTSASLTKPLEVGLNYLIKVTCKRKRQIYCQLCSVRLEESAHVTTFSHKYNYVKKLFGCDVTPPQLESKLDKIVAHLHEAEKDVGSQDMQTMEVKIDVYNELRALPVDKAIKRLKEKLRWRNSRLSSRISASSCEASSPDDAGKMERNQDVADPLPTDPEAAGMIVQTAETIHKSILIGEMIQGPSNLSVSLRVKGSKPIIGLSSIWECRGISSNKLPSFFLCESCMATVFNRHICEHMFSAEHQLNYALRRYPQHTWFWKENDLTHGMKMHILMGVVKLLSQQEFVAKMDAQAVLLREDLYNFVKTAPFSEALKVVQRIKKEPHLSVFSVMQQYDQQARDPRLGQERSLSTDDQSPQSLHTDQRSDNEARQKSENHHLKETVMDGNLDGDKQRRVLNPLDLTSVSSTIVDSVGSSLPGADTCHGPQETCWSPSVKPGPPESQQRPELQVKQAGVLLESPSSCESPKTSQTSSLSPRNKCLPIKKRPAVASLETQIKPDTSNPQLDHPLPAKCTCSHSEHQPSTDSASKFTSVNPDASSTLLPTKDEEAAPIAEDNSIVDWGKYTNLVALIKKMKSDLNVSSCTLQLDNSKSATSCAGNSPQRGVESQDSGSKLESKTGRWDSKFQHIQDTIKQNQLSAASSEMFSTTVVSCENHVATLETNWTEAKAESTIDPQHQINVNTKSMFGNLNQFEPDLAETDSTGNRQFPIKAIGTTNPDPANKGGFNGWNHAEVNGGSWLAHRRSTVATANYRPNLTSSGQYVLSNQMAYGQISNSLPDEAVTHYTLPGYTGSSYQHGAYNPRGFYPSQIYPEQNTSGFGHSTTSTVPGCLSLEMQQQLMQRWQQQLMLQQQLMQQHYYSFTGAALASGSGNVTNDVAYQGALPFTAQSSGSQMFTNLNEYSTHIPQVYPNPPAADFPITNSEVTSQTLVNPIFASKRGFFLM